MNENIKRDDVVKLHTELMNNYKPVIELKRRIREIEYQLSVIKDILNMEEK